MYAPEKSLLFDSTILDAGLPLRHAVLEVALNWVREFLQISIAETVLVFTRVICKALPEP